MSDYIPDEIVRNILLKLPVKSVIKCTLVCKPWRSMIKSSPFIQSHLCSTIHSNNENDTHLLLLSASSYSNRIIHQHHWLHWDTPEFGEYSELSNPRTPCHFSNPHVIGTSNGLVCFDNNPLFTGVHLPAFIWNPSIKKIVMLPKPPTCFTKKDRKYDKYASHSFGYDSHSGDYKVLRIVTLPDDHSDLSRFATEAQVYSLGSGSWKNLSAAVIPPHLSDCGEGPPFVNGKLHFLEARVRVYYFDNAEEFRKGGGDPLIASFDLSTEVFGEIMMPKGLEEGPCRILKYGECLALVRRNDMISWLDQTNCGCDIWVMKEYGVVESWTYLYKIALVDTSIYGFKRCGEVLLNERNNRGGSRMLWYDPKSKQGEVFGSDFESDEYSYYFFDSFVESLVLLDHPNAIPYPEPKKKTRWQRRAASFAHKSS